MKNGVPFDVAWSVEDEEAMAWAIIFGQMDGNQWDWNLMRWKKPDS